MSSNSRRSRAPSTATERPSHAPAQRQSHEARQDVETRLGYFFRDPTKLTEALTHRSFANEARQAGRCKDNERLEFLGDAVLGAHCARLLFARFPEADEGELSQRRATLVCESMLAELAVEGGIDQALALGRGEEQSGGRSKPRLLASALEACIGAIEEDGGTEATWRVVSRLLASRIAASSPSGISDYKSRLQAAVQGTMKVNPTYNTLCVSGPQHEQRFEVGVWVGDELLAKGEGRSRSAAEQEAARAALEALPARR